MRSLRFVVATLFVLSGSGLLLAQDPVKTNPEVYKVLVDNSAVRVLEATLAANAKTVMHSHPDTIIVPLGAAKARFTTPDGKTVDQDMANESATYAPAGAHSGGNIGSAVRIIIVELKGAAGKATLPTTRPGMTIKVLAEGAKGMAYRSTADAKFAEAAGTTHDFDQVVIALGSAQIALTINGKPTKTSWARGDVQFVGRGVPHEAKNTGGKPADMIIVAIK